MTNIIERQVGAFADADSDAHQEAATAQDVDDLIRSSPSLAGVLRDAVERSERRGPIDPSRRALLVGLCNESLGNMADARSQALAFRAAGFPLDDGAIEVHDEAALDVRELLARVADPTPWSAVTIPSAAELAVGSKPPPQAWFDEDMTGLDSSV